MTWFQLSYASSEGKGADPGGWQVQGRLPADLPASIEEVLRAHVVTRLLEVPPTDEFADSAELAARPRRLVFTPVPDGLAWWHAASAGKDATGRPGNVFNHAALLTGHLSGPAGALRPIDLWRSPDWLAPFGSAEVARAALGECGRPGPVGRESAVAFIQEHADALESVLGAVAWMFAERRRHVVLVTETADEFARWVSAISHLTAPALARQVPFVTYERTADSRSDLPPWGLVGVPAPEVADNLRSDGTRVLDVRRLPEDPVDGFWEYDGQRWPVDPLWQDALYGASGLAPADLLAVLEVMDEITAPLGDDDRLSAGWPLALALLKVAPKRVQEREALVESWRDERPWDGLRDAELRQLLQEAPREPEQAAPDPSEAPPADEMRVLLDAATRLVEHGKRRPGPEQAAVNRCIQLLLTHGLPEQADPAAARRAEAFLALGSVLPTPIRFLLLQWRTRSAAVGRSSRG